jgi:hypothetical protein
MPVGEVAKVHKAHPNINVLSGNHWSLAAGVLEKEKGACRLSLNEPEPLPGDSFLRYVTAQ